MHSRERPTVAVASTAPATPPAARDMAGDIFAFFAAGWASTVRTGRSRLGEEIRLDMVVAEGV